MVIPVLSIVAAVIILALVLWVIEQFKDQFNDFVLKVARVVLVTLCVLWIVAALTGNAPSISFR